TLDDPLGINTTITGIDGTTIVGYWGNPNTDSAGGFIATPVPEPTSLALLSVGAFLLLRRRRSGLLIA
ncbi:MAG: PEP-CTERM sorting domain-containing protein, partial [Tepidisphaeraceae bacterium]